MKSRVELIGGLTLTSVDRVAVVISHLAWLAPGHPMVTPWSLTGQGQSLMVVVCNTAAAATMT